MLVRIKNCNNAIFIWRSFIWRSQPFGKGLKSHVQSDTLIMSPSVFHQCSFIFPCYAFSMIFGFLNNRTLKEANQNVNVKCYLGQYQKISFYKKVKNDKNNTKGMEMNLFWLRTKIQYSSVIIHWNNHYDDYNVVTKKGGISSDKGMFSCLN